MLEPHDLLIIVKNVNLILLVCCVRIVGKPVHIYTVVIDGPFIGYQPEDVVTVVTVK